MTTTATIGRQRQHLGELAQTWPWPAAAIGASIIAGVVLVRPGGAAIGVAAAAAVLAVGYGLVAPTSLLYTLVCWLAMLGLVRRLAVGLGTTPFGDPLLLVAPAAMIVLLAVAAIRGAFRARSPLANSVLLLSVLTLLEALNPLQGSLLAGVAGLLFSLVPLLAFWIGRAVCTDAVLTRVLRMVAVLGILAAAYGLYQALVRFPSWDARWIARNADAFHALFVNGTARPFASFSSPTEYAFFLAIATVLWLCVVMGRSGVVLMIPAIGLLVAALVYATVRGPVVLLIFALGLVVAAQRGSRLTAAFATSSILLVVLSLIAGHFAQDVRNASGQPLVAHQVNGLANPLNPEESTLGTHLHLFKEGLASAVHEPLGIGVSAVSRAGAKLGTNFSNTEADPSNAAIALGIPGLIAYAGVLLFGLRAAYGVAAARRSRLALAALGVIAATLFQWLNGGQYAVAFIVWLVLGWIDRTSLGDVDA